MTLLLHQPLVLYTSGEVIDCRQSNLKIEKRNASCSYTSERDLEPANLFYADEMEQPTIRGYKRGLADLVCTDRASLNSVLYFEHHRCNARGLKTSGASVQNKIELQE
jgi:hypothetical protein